MIHLKYTDTDQRYVFIKCDDRQDEIRLGELIKYINLVDPICYLPTYKGIPYTQDSSGNMLRRMELNCGMLLSV